MNNNEEESSRDQIERENPAEGSPKDDAASDKIHPETDNPDELDPRLFSPLQESDSTPAEERIPETPQTEEENCNNDGESEEDTSQA